MRFGSTIIFWLLGSGTKTVGNRVPLVPTGFGVGLSFQNIDLWNARIDWAVSVDGSTTRMFPNKVSTFSSFSSISLFISSVGWKFPWSSVAVHHYRYMYLLSVVLSETSMFARLTSGATQGCPQLGTKVFRQPANCNTGIMMSRLSEQRQNHYSDRAVWNCSISPRGSNASILAILSAWKSTNFRYYGIINTDHRVHPKLNVTHLGHSNY
jgi:hypothetical protein